MVRGAVFLLAAASAATLGGAVVPGVPETYVMGGASARVCPRGNYCTAGVKRPCPIGSFQDGFGQARCKQCPPGRVCPAGSVSPLPAGRGARGAARGAAAVVDTRIANPHNASESELEEYEQGEQDCNAGFFWSAGRCQLCTAGYYCPRTGVGRTPCPDDTRKFCPQGSETPLIVEAGRYVDKPLQREVMCEPGYYVDDMAVRRPCPAGRYGNRFGETRQLCSGACEAGYVCPEGSIRAQERLCTDASTYCPAGSGAPVAVSVGYYSNEARSEQLICPTGSYCVGGVRYPCPAGSFNPGSLGLSAREQCTVCPTGYICHGELKRKCGGAAFYCPQGDPFNPRLCPSGSYTVGEAETLKSTATECHAENAQCETLSFNAWYYPLEQVQDDPEARSATKPCPPGHYCVDGKRFECAPGRFGEAGHLSTPDCSGKCEAGFYCPAASTSATQHSCPDAFYCPLGSGSPVPVALGHYVSSDRSKQIPCTPGTYCVEGVMYPCAAGKYTEETGMQRASCSGLCPPGHYCTERTARPIRCTDPANYCPIGSAMPLPVPIGYMSNLELSWVHQCQPGTYCSGGISRPCPPGVYGSTWGLSSPDCSGPCSAGHFCTEGSADPAAFPCSRALGKNDDGMTFQFNDLSDPTCLVNMLDVYPEQFFEFSLLPDRAEEDTYLWNLAHARLGEYGVENTMAFDFAERAFRSTGNQGDYIKTGWRPGSGPKTMCMWKKFVGDSATGLDGMQKVESTNDYFMIGTYWSSKNRIFVSSGAERGSYADTAVVLNQGEWVFYCLASGGARQSSQAYLATPRQGLTLVWSQSDNGDDRGIVDPALSMIYGQTSTGETDRPMYHDPGRHALSDALYGGVLHWNEHLSAQQLEKAFQVTSYFYYGPDSYHDGIRRATRLQCGGYASQEWEQGFQGRNVGPLTTHHLEKDKMALHRPVTQRVREYQQAVGLYKFVQTSPRAFQWPDFEVPLFPWVLGTTPQALYCPSGSGLPKIADEGYYTGIDNAERQMLCPAGHYCTLGVKHACPAGTFGETQGLVSASCTAMCPAAHECPSGSIRPLPCPAGHYAPPASAVCVDCQAARPIPCQTSRDCCTFKPLQL